MIDDDNDGDDDLVSSIFFTLELALHHAQRLQYIATCPFCTHAAWQATEIVKFLLVAIKERAENDMYSCGCLQCCCFILGVTW